MASSPSCLRMTGTTNRDRRWLAPMVVLLALVFSSCDNSRNPNVPEANTTTLVVSEAWRAGASAEESVARVAALQKAIDELREETGTGWIGRQDDVTGYLADLSGGSRLGPPEEFMDAYGPALFGVDSSVLDLESPDTETVPGMVSTRAAQTVGEVPVRDAVLLFNSNAGSVPAADRLAGVRGRVFPGLTVGTEPQIGRRDAALTAAEASQGGSVRGRTRLVVIPTGEGQLTWEVTIVGGTAVGSASALYYVDALTGDVVDVRPTSVDTAPAALAAEPDPNSVEVTGTDPFGTPRTAHGLRTPDGIAMTDTTTQAWDSAGRTGDISTYDATGLRDFSQLPGRLVVNPDTRVRDPEVLAAQAYGREVIDYYQGLGRDSWDDNGGSLIASVHYGPPDFCNAMFNGVQMLFGNPCVRNGQTLSASVVDVDITAHEVTHGVTETSAGLIYSGQSGALNESFSDYFGNVIGNLSKGAETDGYAEDTCTGMPGNTFWCQANPDGTVSQRYMLNGNGLDQYLRLLNLGTRMQVLLGFNQDNGGVHSNSAIWNNALWAIRTQLARIDNQPGNDSPLAQSFDRAVYGALVTRLTPTSGFLDARTAVEQVIIDSGLDPVVLRVAREVFDANSFCAGCIGSGTVAGDEVSTAVQTEVHPAVSGTRIAWLDFSTSNFAGQVGSGDVGGGPASLGSASDVLEVVFAGEATATLHLNGQIRRTDPSGSSTVLSTVDPVRTVATGFSGSDTGAAWATADDAVSFLDPGGSVTPATLPGLAGDTITSVATGGGHVAAATEGGKVFSWRPGGQPRQVGTMGSDVLSLAAYAGNVLAISSDFRARLFAASGQQFDVSDSAMFFLGAAVSADYAVWANATGMLDSGVAPDTYNETDLFVLSLKTGKVYNLIPADGQQGFPALSGRRLVWQDAGAGSDDIRTFELPAGL